MLRYVKFHPKQPHCEHCNAGLLKGAVELSDGKKYGRDCAARAMGKPRESASMKKHVDDLRAKAIRAQHGRGYSQCISEKWSWTWQSKAYGGNCKWPLTNHYHTQSGQSVLEVRWDANLFNTVSEDKIIGYVIDGWMYLSMTPVEATVLSDEMTGNIQWTSNEFADWQPNKGWDL